MKPLKIRASLRRKLYGIAALFGLMSVALALNAFLPLMRMTGQVAIAKRDVAGAMAVESAARRSAEWLWHVGALVVRGTAERNDVEASFVATVQALNSWIAHESRTDDSEEAREAKVALADLDEVADRIGDSVRHGDLETATALLLKDLSQPAPERLLLPLEQMSRHERFEMRKALVSLSADAAAAGPLSNDLLTSHVVDAADAVERAVALSSFSRMRVTQATLLTLSLLGADAFEPAALPVFSSIASSELETWTELSHAAPDRSVRESIATIRDTDRSLDALSQGMLVLLESGQDAEARQLFASEYAPALNEQLSAVRTALAEDEAVASASTTRVIGLGRVIAVVMALFAIIVLVLALASALGAHRVARRITQTTRAVRRLGAGARSVEVPVEGSDELAELSQAFNDLGRDLAAARAREAWFVQQVIDAGESERMKLAAELHDGPIQRLTGVLYGLDRAGARSERGDVEGIGELIAAARANVSNEVGTLRRFLAELRPPVLDERGLDAALDDYVSEFSKRCGISSELDAQLRERLPNAVETTIYRVVQEALANVGKHSRGSVVRVALWRQNDDVALRISDDGVGFDPSSARGTMGQHFGLTAMQERVRIAGGTFTIDSGPGRGTTIFAVFPHRQEVAA